MEMGAAAIMANTALATAGDVPQMASAFGKAVEAEEKHTWPVWEESLPEVHPLPIR